MYADREPTITDIKRRIAQLNTDINNFATERINKNNQRQYLQNKNDSISQEIRNIHRLLQNVVPKIEDNNTLKDKNIPILLAKLAESQATYADLVEHSLIPNYFDASNEETKINAESNFNQYVLYLIFIIFFMIGLFFVLKNPEAGNLDMLMLILAIYILLYYVYQYYVMKSQSK